MGAVRHVRVSLEKWSNREIRSKTEAEAVFDKLRNAVRSGTFDKRRLEVPRETTTLTFRQFAEIHKARHVFAKKLAIAKTIDHDHGALRQPEAGEPPGCSRAPRAR